MRSPQNEHPIVRSRSAGRSGRGAVGGFDAQDRRLPRHRADDGPRHEHAATRLARMHRMRVVGARAPWRCESDTAPAAAPPQ